MRAAILFSALALGSSVFAAPLEVVKRNTVSSTTAVTGLTTLNVLTGTANADAKKINVVNLPFAVPALITDLTALNTGYATVLSAQTAQGIINQSFDEAGSAAVLAGYKTLAASTEALLAILTGKYIIISQLPFFGEPIRASLVALERSVDAYSLTLINLADAATQTAIRNEADSLAVAFTSTINTYSQVQGPIL